MSLPKNPNEKQAVPFRALPHFEALVVTKLGTKPFASIVDSNGIGMVIVGIAWVSPEKAFQYIHLNAPDLVRLAAFWALVKGCSYKMIANECHISFPTVNTHVSSIYAKLKVQSVGGAVSVALKEGLVDQG